MQVRYPVLVLGLLVLASASAAEEEPGAEKIGAEKVRIYIGLKRTCIRSEKCCGR